MPVLAPMTAAGLLRSTVSANGRDAQSTAFFSAPGIDELYSGVANSSASARSISARHRSTGTGGLGSSSSSKAGIAFSASNSTNSVPGGSSSAAARSSRRLCEARRSEPATPSTRMP
jgi:hypothetical protein